MYRPMYKQNTKHRLRCTHEHTNAARTGKQQHTTPRLQTKLHLERGLKVALQTQADEKNASQLPGRRLYLGHAFADDLDDRALCPPVELLQLLLHVSLEVPVGFLGGDVQLLLVLRFLPSSKIGID